MTRAHYQRGKLHSELAAMERRWARNRRVGAAALSCLWAAFALIVFAGVAFETGKVGAAAHGQLSGIGLEVVGVQARGGADRAGVRASHLRGGPSVVDAPIHSKTEGKCR